MRCQSWRAAPFFGGGVWEGTPAIFLTPKDSKLAPWTWQFFALEPGEKRIMETFFETVRFYCNFQWLKNRNK